MQLLSTPTFCPGLHITSTLYIPNCNELKKKVFEFMFLLDFANSCYFTFELIVFVWSLSVFYFLYYGELMSSYFGIVVLAF